MYSYLRFIFVCRLEFDVIIEDERNFSHRKTTIIVLDEGFSGKEYNFKQYRNSYDKLMSLIIIAMTDLYIQRVPKVYVILWRTDNLTHIGQKNQNMTSVKKKH